jgi:hypothetical protein
MNKAQWATNLLRDPMWQEMMEDLRGNELTKFVNSNYGEAEIREQAYMRLRVLESVESYLESMAAQKMIDEKRMKIL